MVAPYAGGPAREGAGADGAVAFDPATDHEGFSAGAEQFDSDITAERHPRAALGHRGHLLNRPYSTQDQPAPQTRRVVTALAFE